MRFAILFPKWIFYDFFVKIVFCWVFFDFFWVFLNFHDSFEGPDLDCLL